MSLKARLEEDMKRLMKERDSFKLGVVRFILAQVKNREIDSRRPLSDEEIIKVLQGLVKQRKEGILIAEKSGRADILAKEQNELALVEGYLPAQMSVDDLNATVDAVVIAIGASSMKDMGKVIKEVMTRTAGRADGTAINDAVKKRLTA